MRSFTACRSLIVAFATITLTASELGPLQIVSVASPRQEANAARLFLPLTGIFGAEDLLEASGAQPDDWGWQHFTGFEDIDEVSDMAVNPIDGQPWLAIHKRLGSSGSRVVWRDRFNRWHGEATVAFRGDLPQRIEIDARGDFWAALDSRIWWRSADGLRAHRYDAADGLDGGAIWAIDSGPTGIWVASEDHVEFLADGAAHWQRIDVPEGSSVFRVFADPRDGAWITGLFTTGFILHWSPSGVVRSWGPEDGLGDTGIAWVAFSPSGEIWAAGGPNLVRMDSAGRWYPVTPAPNLERAWIADLHFDAMGFAWYTDGDSTVYRHHPDGQFDTFELSIRPNELVGDGLGGAWLGLGYQGMPFGHLSATGELRTFTMGDANWFDDEDYRCTSLAVDKEGRPICGGDDAAVLRLEHDDQVRVWIPHGELHQAGLHIGFDMSGRTWVGTMEGMSRWTGEHWRNLHSADGLPGLEGPSDGGSNGFPRGPIVWSTRATNSGLVFAYDQRIAGSHYPFAPGLARLSPEGVVEDLGGVSLEEYVNISTILEPSPGEWWLVTKELAGEGAVSSLGIPIVDILRRPDSSADWQSIGFPAVVEERQLSLFDASIAPNGGLWLASSEGLLERDPNGAWARHPTADDRILGRIDSIAVRDDGTVWLGGAQLGRRDPDGRWELFERPNQWPGSGASSARRILDIELAPDGSVWCLVDGFGVSVRLTP